jgi:hypothetical protein
MRGNTTTVVAALILTALFCCPYFSFGETPNPQETFETLVESPIPAGVTPIAADYEAIGLGDGYSAVHFIVESAELMDSIIEKHALTEELCTYADPQHPLEDWQTAPDPDGITCFEHTVYREGESGAIDHQIILYTNEDHTEGVFKIIYF